MITATFQLAGACGPRREQRLWESGVTHWSQYAAATSERAGTSSASRPRLPGATDAALRRVLGTAHAALAAGDADRLAALLPVGEHWRLFGAFGENAAYLDIETNDDATGLGGISAIGWLDRQGLRLLLAGRDLERFPELARGWSLLVTFNGLSFDVPILRQAFPEWRPPVAHLDVRHALARLGVTGGLKEIEKELTPLRLERPAHIAGLTSMDTGWLFRRGRDGDREALRRFAEYNLYDVIALPTLAAHAYNGLLERYVRRAPALRGAARALHVPGRGDVLYDVSKILMRL